MPYLVIMYDSRVHNLNLVMFYCNLPLKSTIILNEQQWKRPITMDTLKNYQSIVDSYYKIPHQYMSLIDIFKHVVEHNTWNITHTL